MFILKLLNVLLKNLTVLFIFQTDLAFSCVINILMFPHLFKIEAKMERPFENIDVITDKKDFWKLAVRVKDKWTVVKDGKEHLEMIIVDAKVIHVLFT